MGWIISRRSIDSVVVARRSSWPVFAWLLSLSTCESKSESVRPQVGYGVSDGCEGAPAPAECKHPPVKERCEDGWCYIPKGCFVMGSPQCEWGRALRAENESVTTLTRDFWMKQTEVTQAEWTSLGLPNPSVFDAPKGLPADCVDPTCPVGNVTWFEAVEFANRLSTAKGLEPCFELVGCKNAVGGNLLCEEARQRATPIQDCGGYRLPTEAEWEYATRAGTRTATYAGDLALSGDASRCDGDRTLSLIAWYCRNSDFATHPVAKLERNQWGLFDVSGNALEWTTDEYVRYETLERTDPGGVVPPREQVAMVTRGGSATGFPTMGRSSYRQYYSRALRAPSFGFRLVRTVK